MKMSTVRSVIILAVLVLTGCASPSPAAVPNPSASQELTPNSDSRSSPPPTEPSATLTQPRTRDSSKFGLTTSEEAVYENPCLLLSGDKVSSYFGITDLGSSTSAASDTNANDDAGNNGNHTRKCAYSFPSGATAHFNMAYTPDHNLTIEITPFAPGCGGSINVVEYSCAEKQTFITSYLAAEKSSSDARDRVKMIDLGLGGIDTGADLVVVLSNHLFAEFTVWSIPYTGEISGSLRSATDTAVANFMKSQAAP